MFLMSDTHFEWDEKRQDYNDIVSKPSKNNDIVILAGDIAGGRYVMEFVHHLLNLDYQVVFTPGNHEYYGFDIDELDNYFREESDKNKHFHFLQNDSIILNGKRFIGSTLWTSCDTVKYNYETDSLERKDINYFVEKYVKKSDDFKLIKNFSIDSMVDRFWKSVDFIDGELNTQFNGKTIVVTHHAPSFESIHPAYLSKVYSNHGFASDLDRLIMKYQPHLWVHGHLHHNIDYSIGNTNVRCEPRGYHDLDAINPEFTWMKPLDKKKSPKLVLK